MTAAAIGNRLWTQRSHSATADPRQTRVPQAVGGPMAAVGPNRRDPRPRSTILCQTAAMVSRFLSLADVQEMLNISATQAYSLVRSGELPAIQIGPKKVWRVEASKLEEYIEGQYAKTRERVDAGEL